MEKKGETRRYVLIYSFYISETKSIQPSNFLEIVFTSQCYYFLLKEFWKNCCSNLNVKIILLFETEIESSFGDIIVWWIEFYCLHRSSWRKKLIYTRHCCKNHQLVILDPSLFWMKWSKHEIIQNINRPCSAKTPCAKKSKFLGNCKKCWKN